MKKCNVREGTEVQVKSTSDIGRITKVEDNGTSCVFTNEYGVSRHYKAKELRKLPKTLQTNTGGYT